MFITKKQVLNFALVSAFTALALPAFAGLHFPPDHPPESSIQPVRLCSFTAQDVATVLANSADELAQLKAREIDTSTFINCTKIENGVRRYDFSFSRGGMRIPESAVLTVIQDMRPTFRDGAAIYTKSIQ